MIAVPDTSAILAAEHLPQMRTALRSVDVSDPTIFQRLTDFATADADLTERSNQSLQRAIAVAEPAPAQAFMAGNADWFHSPMLQVSFIRVGIAIFMLAASAILGAVARRGMRLSAHIDAFADALVLSGGRVDEGFMELARTLSPSGEVPRDLVDATTPGSRWRQALHRRRSVRDAASDLMNGTMRLFRVKF
jgi:hypothetical protein